MEIHDVFLSVFQVQMKLMECWVHQQTIGEVYELVIEGFVQQEVVRQHYRFKSLKSIIH